MLVSKITRLAREPLLHFLVLGLCLFAAYAVVNDESAIETDARIVVTASDLDWLRQNFVRQWNRSPSATELEQLIDGHVREEVLYREALAMGLDANDTNRAPPVGSEARVPDRRPGSPDCANGRGARGVLC